MFFTISANKFICYKTYNDIVSLKIPCYGVYSHANVTKIIFIWFLQMKSVFFR